MWRAKALIRVCACANWCKHSLFIYDPKTHLSIAWLIYSVDRTISWKQTIEKGPNKRNNRYYILCALLYMYQEEEMEGKIMNIDKQQQKSTIKTTTSTTKKEKQRFESLLIYRGKQDNSNTSRWTAKISISIKPCLKGDFLFAHAFHADS